MTKHVVGVQVVLAVIFVAAPPFAQSNSDGNSVVSVGASGNLAVLTQGESNQSAPAIGGRAGFVQHRSYDDSTIFRISAEYLGGWHSDENGRRSYQGAQGRIGIGLFDFDKKNKEKKGAYYMLFSDFNYDGATQNDERKSALVSVSGGEVGREFSFGGTKDNKTSALFIGVNSGIGVLRATNGRKVDPSFALDKGENAVPKPRFPMVDNNFGRTAFATGVSVDGRFGSSNKAGTVHIHGTGTLLGGQGNRADVSGDVNISSHIQVGGGVREIHFKDPGRSALTDVAPFVRVTLSK